MSFHCFPVFKISYKVLFVGASFLVIGLTYYYITRMERILPVSEIIFPNNGSKFQLNEYQKATGPYSVRYIHVHHSNDISTTRVEVPIIDNKKTFKFSACTCDS